MALQTISLKRSTWTFDEDEPLGSPGGFGAVFAGAGRDGTEVAVKRLHASLAASGSREIEVAEALIGHRLAHVIPILDVGLDKRSESFFIVMARADMTMQDLVLRSAPIPEPEAVEILDAIAAGLEELGPVIHRDLKPANVLLHNGVWKLADLGLARQRDAATAINTVKDFLTPAYAAPEQWRNERATKATDVYALGCLIYVLVNANPPFPGPEEADYSRQHQFEAPPTLEASARLRAIAAGCLAKSPAARPTIDGVRSALRNAREGDLASGGRGKLAKAVALLAEEELAAAAAEQRRNRAAEERKQLAKDAGVQIRGILAELVTRVQAEAEGAVLLPAPWPRYGGGVQVGRAELWWQLEFPYLDVPVGPMKWDVIAGAVVGVMLSSAHYPCGRSANLFLARLAGEAVPRWWEVAFRETEAGRAFRDEASAFVMRGAAAGNPHHEPYALYERNDPSHASLYFWESGSCELAVNPCAVDPLDPEDFYSRWAGWLAEAVVGGVRDTNPFDPPPPKEDILPKFLKRGARPAHE